MEYEYFHKLLAAGVQHGASDVHLRVGVPPGYRVRGVLVPAKMSPLSAEETESIVSLIMKATGKMRSLEDLLDTDLAYAVPGLARFRVNVYRQKNTLSLVMRIIAEQAPTIEKLGLPPAIQQIAGSERGLILVTGVTGSGKSSTIAAMVDHVNESRSAHIVTIEDPIEFLHVDKRSSISQRELGNDTVDFASGLRASLRQDPDVIVVGEMRDRESVESAIKATETGHAVYSTLHTRDAPSTISRLLGIFSSEEQKNLRHRLSESLHAIVSQRLLPRADKPGLCVACEIMVCSAAVRDAIIDPTIVDLRELIAEGKDPYGMQTFDQHLLELYKSGAITKETALGAATRRADFEHSLMYG